MSNQMQGSAQDVDVGVRGAWGLNNSIITQEIRPDFTLNPGAVDVERDVSLGSAATPAQYNAQKGGYDLTGQQYSFESARMVRYRAGGLQFAGSLLVIPDDPAGGHVDFGLGRVPYDAWETSGTFQASDDEVLLRLTSNGDWALVIRSGGTETIIPRDGSAASWSGPAAGRSWVPGESESLGIAADDQAGDLAGRYWGFDAMDGEGPGDQNPSGIDLDARPLAVLPKLIGTWYGKGPWYLAFEAAGPNGYQRPWRAAAFEAEGQAVNAQPTQPLMIRYDDDGSGESYDMEVYGRQGSGSGGIGAQPKTPWHLVDGFDYGTGFSNASLVLAYRRAPEDTVAADVNFRGTTFGLLNIGVSQNTRSVVFTALDPDFGGQTPDWSNPTSIQDGAESVIQVASQDDTASDLTADATTGTLQSGRVVPANDAGQSKGGITELQPVDQPNPRTKPVGVFMFSLDTSTSGEELFAQFEEEGA
jgi:hypothetical protein